MADIQLSTWNAPRATESARLKAARAGGGGHLAVSRVGKFRLVGVVWASGAAPGARDRPPLFDLTPDHLRVALSFSAPAVSTTAVGLSSR